MSFTDQKRRVATEKHCNANWNGGKNGKYFRCYLCGHKFVEGDGWRWVYGDTQTINFCTCDSCDGDDVVERFLKQEQEYKDKYWYKYSR